MAKVSQAIIDEFKKTGMSAALKKYRAGEGSEEFNEGIRRYYPGASKEGPAVKSGTDTPNVPKPVAAAASTKKISGSPAEVAISMASKTIQSAAKRKNMALNRPAYGIIRGQMPIKAKTVAEGIKKKVAVAYSKNKPGQNMIRGQISK